MKFLKRYPIRIERFKLKKNLNEISFICIQINIKLKYVATQKAWHEFTNFKCFIEG